MILLDQELFIGTKKFPENQPVADQKIPECVSVSHEVTKQSDIPVQIRGGEIASLALTVIITFWTAPVVF
ncbi:MAG: hypothetical protein HY707_01770 [Ignavibacteriae bacterium]|nr:hypothetical protein [Ignavibacteriota bacterium]